MTPALIAIAATLFAACIAYIAGRHRGWDRGYAVGQESEQFVRRIEQNKPRPRVSDERLARMFGNKGGPRS